MLKMLRAMNQWELAEVCQSAGVPEGARPEEILRALSGAWWAAPWGAMEEERALLLRAAEALNLMPRLRLHRHQMGLVERAVYGALVQRAFVAAPEEQQTTLLAAAQLHLEPGHPALVSARAHFSDQEARQLSLQLLVSTGPGLRAVTRALTEVAVRPGPMERGPGPSALFTALAAAGPEAWSGRVVEWVRARRGPDLAALFSVLHLCWRQRQRLLLELRTGAAALQDEEKRLVARLQALALDRAAARRRRPWHRQPISGLAVAAGALVAASAQLVLAGSPHELTGLAAGAGCLWSVAAVATSPTADPERRAVLETLRRTRRQREAVEKQISQLEE